MIIEAILIAIVVLFGLVFVAVGVISIGGAGRQLWERYRDFVLALQSRHWVGTTGRITRSVVTYTTTRRSRLYTPSVRYTYSVGGETFVSERLDFVAQNGGGGEEGEASARAAVERFPTGATVPVFYDPENPKRATVDRSVPSLVGFTLFWLFVLITGGGIGLSLGVNIVRGPFEDPPDLGEVPSLTAQAGGVAVALGVLFLLVAAARAVGERERRQRKLIRHIESARSMLIHEVRAGEQVVVSGRAEELEGDDEDTSDAVESDDEDDEFEDSTVELPFENGPLVYYDVDVEWFRRTCFCVFGVRDASGVAHVEIQETESTLLEQRTLRIEGEVERWLVEERDDTRAAISADSRSLRIERIRTGDNVLVVGTAEREDDDLVFRARPGDPTSLLVADGTREEVVARLKKRLGRTRAYLVIGALLVVAGGVAVIFF